MHNDHWWSSDQDSHETSTLIAELDRLAAERDRLSAELDAARRQIGALTESAGAGSEREELARVIQDTMSQELTSLVLAVKRGRRELRTGNTKGAAKQFNALEENLRRALTDTRKLVATGAPVGIVGGLTTALLALGDSAEQDSGISVIVRAQGTTGVTRATEEILLACAAVALSNVREHSGATTASVTVNSTHDSVVLRVADNGRGFDSEGSTTQGDATDAGTGSISALRAQLERAGGTLLVVSTVGNGTSMTATLPADH